MARVVPNASQASRAMIGMLSLVAASRNPGLCYDQLVAMGTSFTQG